jgi:CRISPR/Cas system-associated exonuclease Cas4 (RecB family)
VSSLEVLTGKKHLSHSSVNEYLRCSEKFRLSRVVGIRSEKSWAMIAGNAVHKASELMDLGACDEIADAWDQAWAEQLSFLEEGQDLKATGRVSKAWPNKENRDFWEVNGPVHVRTWVDWRDERLAEGWSILSVEQAFDTNIGDVQVQGFIDRVLVDQHGQARLVDLKSGSRKEPGFLQLAIYRQALASMGLPTPDMGAFFYTRHEQGSVDWQMLTRFSQDLVHKWLNNVKTGIELELFTPRPSDICAYCDVRTHCTAWVA